MLEIKEVEKVVAKGLTTWYWVSIKNKIYQLTLIGQGNVSPAWCTLLITLSMIFGNQNNKITPSDWTLDIAEKLD